MRAGRNLALDGLRGVHEIRPIRHQVGSSLPIGEDDVLVFRVDVGQRSEQVTKINLGAAHASRNEVQGVHPDANHLLIQIICRGRSSAHTSQSFTRGRVVRV